MDKYLLWSGLVLLVIVIVIASIGAISRLHSRRRPPMVVAATIKKRGV